MVPILEAMSERKSAREFSNTDSVAHHCVLSTQKRQVSNRIETQSSLINGGIQPILRDESNKS